MQLRRSFALSILLLSPLRGADADAHPWMPLFDGKSLEGWRASESEESFQVANGEIIARGPRAHLFYVGSVANADFRNFELSIDIRTTPGASSGVYFPTPRFKNLGDGLRPDLTGRGLGRYVLAAAMAQAVRRLSPRVFRTTVGSFNLRTKKTCERLGYQLASTFIRGSDGLQFGTAG